MKPIKITSIDNWENLYKPFLDLIKLDSFRIPVCSNYTSANIPIEHSALTYEFANLPQKSSCTSPQRLEKADKGRIWDCPFSNHLDCVFYSIDIFQIYQFSVLDFTGKEIIYNILKDKVKNGYTYYIYNLSDQSVKLKYFIPYIQKDQDEKAISIFKEYIVENYNSVVSDFKFNSSSDVIEKEPTILEKQNKKSFLLSLISGD